MASQSHWRGSSGRWVPLVEMRTGRAGGSHSWEIHPAAQPVTYSGRMLTANGPMSWQVAGLLLTGFLIHLGLYSSLSPRPHRTSPFLLLLMLLRVFLALYVQ